MSGDRRILVSNDDGFSSEGIQVLADALEPLGEVWVVAPNREQSAVSHALTLDRPLRMEQLGSALRDQLDAGRLHGSREAGSNN